MTGHVKNILIALVISALALAAGIKGYIHHQFKTNIDNTLMALQPFADIKYSDLSTSVLSGKVKLENVRISHSFLPNTLNLGNITFETPGFSYMLKGPNAAMKGDFPSHLGIEINNFTFDLNTELAKWLDKLVSHMQPVYASERKLCGGKAVYGPADYKEMGYSRLLSNLHVAYDFDKSKKTLNFIFKASTHNLADINATINITNISSMSANEVMLGGMPKLENVQVNFIDQTYTNRMLKYCSTLSHMTKEAYIDAEVKQSDRYFDMVWGFSPGPGLRDAYKDFLIKPGKIAFSMHPEKDFNPVLAQTLSAEEIMDKLNVQLKINELPVTDLSFKMPDPAFMAQHRKLMARSINVDSILEGGPIETEKPVLQQKPVKKTVTGYHVINLSEAPNHITDFVIITTRGGSIRKGQLVRINKTNLYVQQKVSGGKFTMTVPRSEVKKIEAYFTK